MVLHHSLKIQHPTLVEGDCLILNPLCVPQPANKWARDYLPHLQLLWPMRTTLHRKGVQ